MSTIPQIWIWFGIALWNDLAEQRNNDGAEQKRADAGQYRVREKSQQHIDTDVSQMMLAKT